ncbi:MAG: hypothetical protein M3457_12720 [Chloroflexota bacterium]|nr:hypothetical protein [Chloroflexota bacterium]
MTNNNLPSDSGTKDTLFSNTDMGPIGDVREGMHVIDAAGEEIGTVDLVQMGNPEAATLGDDTRTEGGGLFLNVAKAFGFENEPDVPAGLRDRLLRLGYIKVNASGLTDRYVIADQIAGVSGDTVRLSLAEDQMIAEE